MPTFTHEPPAASPRLTPTFPHVQRVKLLEGGKPLAVATWHASGDGAQGVAQLLDLVVDPTVRRQGHGTRLLAEVSGQAIATFRAAGIKPRRLWCAVEQKSQIVARGFLTHAGFHHVATMSDVLVKQDALIYMRSFD